MLRVAHILAPAPAGGIETVVRTLASAQQRRGHRVTIVADVETSCHPFVVAAQHEGLDVQELLTSSRRYLRDRRQAKRLLQSLRPDVVHLHGFRADVLHGPVARRMGIATVTTLHGFTPLNWKVRVYEWLQLRAAKRAGAAIAVSQGVAARLRHAGVNAARIHLIRNAYALVRPVLDRETARQALGVPRDIRAIGWVGRLSREKGSDVAVRAMAKTSADLGTLYFLGDGADRESTAALARSLGVSARTRLLGPVPDASTLLRAFDVLLLSSRTEGTPMVILEAMAAETPIVATAVGGVPDVVSEESAWLVPSEQPSAIAAALRSALTDRGEAASRVARAAAVLRDQFGVEQWLDRHDALYASIVR